MDLVKKAIIERKERYGSICADVGVVLDQFSIFEIFDYFVKEYGESSIRYYMEQQIIADEINKAREKLQAN